MESTDNKLDSTDLFTGLANGYQEFRPSYPVELLVELKAFVEKHRNSLWPSSPKVYDVGAGTGILTRQLRSMLGGQFSITGVEPNPEMRIAAHKNTLKELGIDYVSGVAERLPIADGTASVIVVGQAIHWFDRTQFYREVRRGLHRDGVMAIMQNDRAWDISALDNAYEQYLEAASPDYSRHYKDFPYLDELAATDGFSEEISYSVEWVRALTQEQFLGMSLSSTKVQRAIENLGTEEVVNSLNNIVVPFLTTSGRVHVHYRSKLFLAVSH
jgi:ubiquinone/menaquinone biosynthesis C-methylase UbiE